MDFKQLCLNINESRNHFYVLQLILVDKVDDKVELCLFLSVLDDVCDGFIYTRKSRLTVFYHCHVLFDSIREDDTQS